MFIDINYCFFPTTVYQIPLPLPSVIFILAAYFARNVCVIITDGHPLKIA